MKAARLVDADLVIAGEGPEAASLVSQLQQNRLNNVHLIGQVSDIDKVALFRLCTAFVFPSYLRSEAYGLALVESAMFGKPMISCEIGTGTSFINVNNHTGIVVPPEDPAALANAMTSLLEDPVTAGIFGRNAFNRYRDELTAVRMVERYCQLYRSLLIASDVSART
jgi:rhamnosyl/mannosyltransferase